MAWRGVGWPGLAWRGVAWRGVAWHGVAWRVTRCVLRLSLSQMNIFSGQHRLARALLLARGCSHPRVRITATDAAAATTTTTTTYPHDVPPPIMIVKDHQICDMAPTPHHSFRKPFPWEFWNYNTAVLMGQYIPGAFLR